MSESTGYSKLANLMASKHYAIFRKFRSMAVRDLLYQQAELTDMENEFSALVMRDKNIKGEQGLYDGDWYLLSTSKSRNCGGEQWEKAVQIRQKLREYYSSISQYSEMVSRPRARRRDVSMLEELLIDPQLVGELVLSGADFGPGNNSVFHEANSTDLLTLDHRTGERDVFTRLLAGPLFHQFEKFLRIFKRPILSDLENQGEEGSAYEYSDTCILRVVDVLGSILASMTPLLSIIALYFVKRLGHRLAIVCIFTLLFSISLALVTRARRIEIFASTAAFASVQVVFVGTTSISGQT
ncbi:hypothetical protein B0J14DRAFT_699978 [Halenospora varia]|nr:hypothetical protein B0J14DRAFT_699978 [Halenospora varia]